MVHYNAERGASCQLWIYESRLDRTQCESACSSRCVSLVRDQIIDTTSSWPASDTVQSVDRVHCATSNSGLSTRLALAWSKPTTDSSPWISPTTQLATGCLLSCRYWSKQIGRHWCVRREMFLAAPLILITICARRSSIFSWPVASQPAPLTTDWPCTLTTRHTHTHTHTYARSLAS